MPARSRVDHFDKAQDGREITSGKSRGKDESDPLVSRAARSSRDSPLIMNGPSNIASFATPSSSERG